MSNRPEPLTAAEQRDLGRVVIAMRDNGVCWKQVERELGLCERQLRRYAGLALMSDNFPPMSDLADCGTARAA